MENPGGTDAALVTSFGFDQVGIELLVLHPDYVHAVLPKSVPDKYCLKVKEREQISNRYWQDVLVGNHAFAQFKEAPPFAPDQESQVDMDLAARTKYDPASKQYRF
ncbi:fatty acid synthase alpha subunit Lsd1 [Linderina pennispora]|nr:fatty acid synthase alpha subunit Lsd1 [Linderina pennispora]